MIGTKRTIKLNIRVHGALMVLQEFGIRGANKSVRVVRKYLAKIFWCLKLEKARVGCKISFLFWQSFIFLSYLKPESISFMVWKVKIFSIFRQGQFQLSDAFLGREFGNEKVRVRMAALLIPQWIWGSKKGIQKSPLFLLQ